MVFGGVVIFIYYKMINLDSITNENNKKRNEQWPYILDHPYRIIIISGSGSGKTSALSNLINEQNDIDNIYLYVRELSDPECEYLIKKRKDAWIKHVSNPNAFIKRSNTMDDVYENINNYNLTREIKNLIVFDEMIANIMTKRRFQAVIKELFIRCRKLNIALVFITQSYFFVPKDLRLNSTHYLIMKINNRRELQNVSTDHSAGVNYQDLKKSYRECTKEPFNFFDNRYYVTSKWSFMIQKKIIKRKITDRIKISDKKIMQNEKQYDLGRKDVKISGLSSHNLDKYKYLGCEDLGLKPSTVEQTECEYSPSSKMFNKGLEKKEGNKEVLLKRLKNVEDLGKKQLDKDSKSLRSISYFSYLSTKKKWKKKKLVLILKNLFV